MKEPINVLLIEDNPGDVRLVETVLNESQEPKINLFVVDNLARGLKYIAAESIQVVLLDLNLPDSQGIQTFQKTHKFAMKLPIVVMSIISDKELIYQAMKEGAHDYVIKGQIQHDGIIRAIRYAIWSYHKREE